MSSTSSSRLSPHCRRQACPSSRAPEQRRSRPASDLRARRAAPTRHRGRSRLRPPRPPAARAASCRFRPARSASPAGRQRRRRRVCELVDLLLSTEKRRRGNRQVRLVQRLQRREVSVPSWKRRSGALRSFSRCRPRSRTSTPARSAVACDSSTCPPCPAAAIRAARCTSIPDVALVGPQRLPGVQPHPHPDRTACKARAAHPRQPPRHRRHGQTPRRKRRPGCRPRPRHAAATPRATHAGARQAPRRTRHPAPASSRVDPSMSVKRNVTVPVGSSGCTRRFSPVARRTTRARLIC